MIRFELRQKSTRWGVGALLVMLMLLGGWFAAGLFLRSDTFMRLLIDYAFQSDGSKQLTGNAWLHRTSGSVVGLYDKEEFGLLDGNVLRIGTFSDKRGDFAFEYVGRDPAPDGQFTTNYAVLNSISGKMEPLQGRSPRWKSVYEYIR